MKGEHMKSILDIVMDKELSLVETVNALEAREKELDKKFNKKFNDGLMHLNNWIKDLLAQLELYQAKESKNYWIWQGDDSDHLESLVCPIIITPSQMLARDAAIAKRVKKILSEEWPWKYTSVSELINSIYEPEKLPAGLYLQRRHKNDNQLYLFMAHAPFVPAEDSEYKLIENPFTK